MRGGTAVCRITSCARRLWGICLTQYVVSVCVYPAQLLLRGGVEDDAEIVERAQPRFDLHSNISMISSAKNPGARAMGGMVEAVVKQTNELTLTNRLV